MVCSHHSSHLRQVGVYICVILHISVSLGTDNNCYALYFQACTEKIVDIS